LRTARTSDGVRLCSWAKVPDRVTSSWLGEINTLVLGARFSTWGTIESRSSVTSGSTLTVTVTTLLSPGKRLTLGGSMRSVVVTMVVVVPVMAMGAVLRNSICSSSSAVQQIVTTLGSVVMRAGL
jgi:hypothetical protein